MSTTAREALRHFLDALVVAQKDNPATQADYAIVDAGAPGVPDLTDPRHQVRSVLDLRTAICLPKFGSRFVFIPDPRDGGEAERIHNEFRDLNQKAQQEQSDEAVAS